MNGERRGFIIGILFAFGAALLVSSMNLYTYTMQQGINKIAVDYPQAGQLWMDNGDVNRDSTISITGGASEYSMYSESAAAPCTFTVYYTIADTANSFTILSDGQSYAFDQGPACDSVTVARNDSTKYAIFTYTIN